MLVKHYKSKDQALLNCGEGQKLVLEGNAIRRWRVVTDEEYGEIIAAEKDGLLGSATQSRSGNFLGI